MKQKITWPDGRARVQTLAARTKTAAKVELAELVSKAKSGRAAPPSKRTFDDVADEFENGLTSLVDAGRKSERTLDTYRFHLRLRLRPAFGTLEVQKITPDRIAVVVAQWREQGLAESTIRATFVVLGRVLKLAVRRGYIASSPLARLDDDERPRNDAPARAARTRPRRRFRSYSAQRLRRIGR